LASTIQAGINAANNDDTVLVAPGKYVENINFDGKAITETSGKGPKVTIIDGGTVAPVVVFTTKEDTPSVLNRFTLQKRQWLLGGRRNFYNRSQADSF
jgi:hypothetical protein